MFTITQIILIALAAFLIQWEMNNSQQFIKCFGEKVFTGLIVGLIMGDYKTGLLIGGTFELMALGVSGFGGASVPNYLVGTAVGTAFAIATNGGLDVALIAGIPTATLGTSIDVVAKMAGSYWLHHIEKLIDKGEFKKVYKTILFANAFGGRIFLANVLPIILYLVLGSTFIDQLLAIIPANVISALNVTGKVLPALGMAILLKYLPVKKNIQYLILGFVLYSYFNLSIMPIALVGAVIAIILFKYYEEKDTLVSNQSANNNGGLGDE